MSLGENIARIRKSKGISQVDFADKLDVSRQSVSLWESNQTVPSLDKLVTISQLLNVSLDELVGKEISGVQAKPLTDPNQKGADIITLISFALAMFSIIGFCLPVGGILIPLDAFILNLIGKKHTKYKTISTISLIASITYFIAGIMFTIMYY